MPPVRFSPQAMLVLSDLCDALVPDDGWPGLEVDALVAHLEALTGPAEAVADRVRAIAAAGEVDPDRLAAGDRALLIELAAEAFYGGADRPGARMLGFDPGPVTPVPRFEPQLSSTPLHRIDDDYDVVVVGAGAGGGVVASVCAAAGASVLVVDRGRVIADAALGRDHLRNHRSPVRGINTGPPEGTPRVAVDGETLVDPADAGWHNNAMVVGGGTRVFAGIAWRFLPDDFRMASRYGVPDGSSLADWPITYDDLEPHYRWVEQTIGVSGDAAAHPAAGPRTSPYPMPPLPGRGEAERLAAGATALGLRTGPVPALINTVERHGRGACVQCGECVGFACPTNARAGTHNTVLPAALATGNATLVAEARANSIAVDAAGRVTGVELLDERTGARRSVRAGHVVVSAGAVESARLLLASASATHPAGLGNHADQVGRHLQGHGFVSAFGRFDDEFTTDDGPGIAIGTLDTAHGLRHPDGTDVVGGGAITNELTKQPIVHFRWALPPDAARHGAAGKAAMRDTFRRTGHLFGHVQEIPTADHRVTLADVVDGAGQPVARLAGRAHPETIRTGAAVETVAGKWMAAAGAEAVWTQPVATGLLAGQHQAGTCRMGDDPATSVVDPTGRVHGHHNLWVADGSVHVTNGSVNPSLTIMALAHRIAVELTTRPTFW